MDIGGLLGDSRVIVPNRVALRVSEIHFLPHRRIFNHVFSSRSVVRAPLLFCRRKERIYKSDKKKKKFNRGDPR